MPNGPNAFAELQEDIDRSSAARRFEGEDAAPAPLATDDEALPAVDEQARWTEAGIQPGLHGAFWTVIASMALITAFLIGTS